MTTELIIHGESIKSSGKDMFSLTDIWKLKGSPENKKPADWLRTDSAKEFIKAVELMCISNYGFKPQLETKTGRHNSGTYAYIQKAVEYARYLDPIYAIEVNDAYIRSKTESKEKKSKVPAELQALRNDGKVVRNQLCSTYKERGVRGIGFGSCTNAAYKGVFNANSDRLREKLGIKKEDSIRDNLNHVQLGALYLTEAIANVNIRKSNAYGNEACEKMSFEAGYEVRGTVLKALKQ